jgi:hypothetical protein
MLLKITDGRGKTLRTGAAGHGEYERSSISTSSRPGQEPRTAGCLNGVRHGTASRDHHRCVVCTAPLAIDAESADRAESRIAESMTDFEERLGQRGMTGTSSASSGARRLSAVSIA